MAGAAANAGVGLGLVGDCVLEEAVEEQTDVAGSTTVEAERELVEVGVELVCLDGALVGAQQPSLQQGGDAMDGRHRGVRVVVAVGNRDRPVLVAMQGEDRIDAGGAGADGGARRDVAVCEGERCGAVDAFEPFQPDAPRLVAVRQLEVASHEPGEMSRA